MWQARRQRQGTSTEQGYGYHYQQARRRYLRDNPWCEDGCGRPADHTHHIIPAADGGGHDADNLLALCKPCHAKRTGSRRTGKAGMAHFVLVCGPPGAGKSTWIDAEKRPEDIVVDLDAIKEALSGLPANQTPAHMLGPAWAAYDAIIRHCQSNGFDGVVFIATSAATQSRRRIAANHVPVSRLVILETPPDTCLQRIRGDEARATKWRLWQPIVEKWWAGYERDERAEIVKA